MKKAQRTKQRILDVSLQLFNEHGERSISTNHICNALDISPGNLYYHFTNKDEIIKQLLLQYQQNTLAYLTVPSDRELVAEDKVKYFDLLSKQIWDYRFLHRDIYHLIENEEFKSLYRQFSQQVMQQSRLIYQAFINAQLMAMNEQELEALIINLWIVLTNWGNFLLITGHGEQANDQHWKWQALRQIAFLEMPYLTSASRESYAKILKLLQDVDIF
ncbi:TetR/AcrR family transcriptional regulator [Moraxella sp. ZY210820]|uniref:TetR/AcrR family transcriptional regulator n=1 Tax=unclassified Moraxella TaxID=2685852 RepID=UPI0027320B09|nr:TetR/AcrR family transcriptional regulator [Moraxella sp. ZY210820]WLF84365.1 TetR/AcrR family transcriptional regulator [Moraxella sp. ZY210820]